MIHLKANWGKHCFVYLPQECFQDLYALELNMMTSNNWTEPKINDKNMDKLC